MKAAVPTTILGTCNFSLQTSIWCLYNVLERISPLFELDVSGALATLVASYLARARGTNEPELSITRTKDLEQFIREVENFRMDHGYEMGDKFNAQLETYRERFEQLLGNANG
jgi:hypothetical protein